MQKKPIELWNDTKVNTKMSFFSFRKLDWWKGWSESYPGHLMGHSASKNPGWILSREGRKHLFNQKNNSSGYVYQSFLLPVKQRPNHSFLCRPQNAKFSNPKQSNLPDMRYKFSMNRSHCSSAHSIRTGKASCVITGKNKTFLNLPTCTVL